MKIYTAIPFILFEIILLSFIGFPTQRVKASYRFADFTAHPPLHIYGTKSTSPHGLAPFQIKHLYNLPESGGAGTIVIIGAYSAVSIEKDLAIFDKAFTLPVCSIENNCLALHPMSTKMRTSSKWALETALDVEWAHAIAPSARLLLVEAATPSGANLLKAIDYAAGLEGVRSISMSWGGAEFSQETELDSHFISKSGAPFFASSGDNGAGVSWPASSPNVIGVGGTSLSLTMQGAFRSESAWSGSGGGVSAYEKAPSFQSSYQIPRSKGMRAVPDVAYNADPSSGYSIVHNGIWHIVGGTSAGAPQWAAIAALGNGISASRLYGDKASAANAAFFRDIQSGDNGSCGYYCTARARYDYVTGLGAPLTVKF
jgi:subtilase family serine protease